MVEQAGDYVGFGIKHSYNWNNMLFSLLASGNGGSFSETVGQH